MLVRRITWSSSNPTAARQHHVQDHQIGRKRRQQAFKIDSVRRSRELETVRCQRRDDGQSDGVAVLNDQDPSPAHTAILPAARAHVA